mgnify:CR=1 FL=1
MTEDNKYFDSTYNLLHNQHISDATIDNAMEIPQIEAVFANAEPGDYFNQILHIAIHQAYVLDRIKQFINNIE